MTKEDILRLRNHCEVTKVQFKERITDKYDVGCEMVAFCNSHGGQLVIGINDKTGAMNPLSYQEVQETTNLQLPAALYWRRNRYHSCNGREA